MFDNLVMPVQVDAVGDNEVLPFFSITDEEDDPVKLKDYPEELPLLALKNTVLFPGVVIPITVGRTKSVKAVKKAFDGDKFIAVFSQKKVDTEDPKKEDL